MIALTLCTIGDIAHMIIRYKYYLTSQTWHTSEQYLATPKSIAYYFGNVTFFILLLLRIKTSFQLSKCTMYYLSLLLTISALLAIAYCFCLFYPSIASFEMWYFYAIICQYLLAIIDFMLNLSLFTLFIYKIKNKDSMEGMEVVVLNKQSIDYDYNSDKKAIWNLMIKHCVLFGIAIISNQTWYINSIIGYTNPKGSPLEYKIAESYTARSVENVINIVIFWLVLKVNNDKYVCLCKCWHSCILKYCMKEDPIIIREGFVMNNSNQHGLLSITGNETDSNMYFFEHGKVEGHNLMVTAELIPVHKIGDKLVEGHNVVITEK